MPEKNDPKAAEKKAVNSTVAAAGKESRDPKEKSITKADIKSMSKYKAQQNSTPIKIPGLLQKIEEEVAIKAALLKSAS